MCNTVLSSLLCEKSLWLDKLLSGFFFCGTIYYAEQGGSDF